MGLGVDCSWPDSLPCLGQVSHAQGGDLTAANRQFANPLASATLWITENNAFVFGGDAVSGNRVNNVTLVNPLISQSVGDTGWLLVHRPILPVWSSLPIPDPPDGFASNKGIGDFTYFKEQLHVFKPLWYSRNSKGFPVSI